MANKITKIQVVEMMLADVNVNSNEVYKAYLENEKALLVKKANSKKPTEKQEVNEGIKNVILDTLSAIERGSITDIVKASAELQNITPSLTPQKMSALLTQLVKSDKVIKEYEKKVAIFSLA